jgi:excisionase family DNA binding protein
MGKTRQLVPLKEVPQHRPWATERYLRRLVSERRIPFHKLGTERQSPVLIDLDDLDRFAEAARIDASKVA